MSDANLKLAREGVAAWNRGDSEAIIEMSVPDLEFVPAVAAGVEGGSVRGADEFRRFFASETAETWDSFQIEVEELREAGDRVVILGRVHAKGRGSGVELDQPVAMACWFAMESSRAR